MEISEKANLHVESPTVTFLSDLWYPATTYSVDMLACDSPLASLSLAHLLKKALNFAESIASAPLNQLLTPCLVGHISSRPISVLQSTVHDRLPSPHAPKSPHVSRINLFAGFPGSSPNLKTFENQEDKTFAITIGRARACSRREDWLSPGRHPVLSGLADISLTNAA